MHRRDEVENIPLHKLLGRSAVLPTDVTVGSHSIYRQACLRSGLAMQKWLPAEQLPRSQSVVVYRRAGVRGAAQN